MKAMIMAAGKGSRLLPLTQNLPKALVPFQGIPLIELVIKNLKSYGFTELVINLFHEGDQIAEFINSNNGFGLEIQFSWENELLDTGGGIKKAIPLLGREPVLFHNVDILTDLDLGAFYQFHLSHLDQVSLAVKNRPTTRSLLLNEQGLLAGWEYPERRIRIVSREPKKRIYPTAFSGIYIINPDVFLSFPEDEVFSLTPWLLEQSSKLAVQTFDHSEGHWYDLGSVENLTRASKEVALDQNGFAIFKSHGK